MTDTIVAKVLPPSQPRPSLKKWYKSNAGDTDRLFSLFMAKRRLHVDEMVERMHRCYLASYVTADWVRWKMANSNRKRKKHNIQEVSQDVYQKF